MTLRFLSLVSVAKRAFYRHGRQERQEIAKKPRDEPLRNFANFALFAVIKRFRNRN